MVVNWKQSVIEIHRQFHMRHHNKSEFIIRAGAIRDATGVKASPGVIHVRDGEIAATGSVEQCHSLLSAGIAIREYRDKLVLPGLVNAHAHLDLTHIGPSEYDGDFIRWVDRIRNLRGRTPAEIACSVLRGIDLSLCGGTALIGDIAGVGSPVPAEILSDSPLWGVSFVEIFGIGRGQDEAARRMRDLAARGADQLVGCKLGLQPHAPYSAGLGLYVVAVELARTHGLLLATHLAEAVAEIEFTSHGEGPFVDLLCRLGKWDDSIRADLGRHPIDHLSEVLGSTPWIAVHLNYVEDRHLPLLSQWPITVAYCPRASRYFGHRDHRYREMLAAGVNVALGTDSIVCLDTPGRISILDEMALLHQRDGISVDDLLRMATVNGADALGFDRELVTLQPGPVAGLIAVPFDPCIRRDPLEQALSQRGECPIERVLLE